MGAGVVGEGSEREGVERVDACKNANHFLSQTASSSSVFGPWLCLQPKGLLLNQDVLFYLHT